MTERRASKHLTEVRSIGRWTAAMLLSFRLGRPDVLPADDYGIRKGFAIVLKRRALPERVVIHGTVRNARDNEVPSQAVRPQSPH